MIFRQTFLHHILAELAAIYPSSVGFLFISLGWTVSIMFDTFDQEYIQAHKHSRQQQINSEINWNQQILKWKRRYFLINNLIHQINRCFSVFLLIFIAGHFARLITTFFYLLTLMNKPSWRLKALLAYELVIMAFHLLSLIYIPHRINRKVKKDCEIITHRLQGYNNRFLQAFDMFKRLNRIDLNEPAQQNQVGFITYNFSKHLITSKY